LLDLPSFDTLCFLLAQKSGSLRGTIVCNKIDFCKHKRFDLIENEEQNQSE
jgi:hypothetical protein